MNILKKNLLELVMPKDRNTLDRITTIHEYTTGKKNGTGGYV